MEELAKYVRIKWWLFCGKQKGKRKRYTEALGCFARVAAADPLHAFALAQAAHCLNKLERYDEAIDAYECALQSAPHYAQVHAHLGQIYGGLGRNREAYDSLQRAFRMRPKLKEDPYWLYALGHSSGNVERWGEALAAFQKILELDKKHGNAWHGLGWAYSHLSRDLEAIAVYENPRSSSPSRRKWIATEAGFCNWLPLPRLRF